MNGSFVDVRPERFVGLRSHTDEHLTPKRPMFVVGVICTKQMTRASIPGRPWAYRTKAAFSDNG
jgi:hypothetical protein